MCIRVKSVREDMMTILEVFNYDGQEGKIFSLERNNLLVKELKTPMSEIPKDKIRETYEEHASLFRNLISGFLSEIGLKIEFMEGFTEPEEWFPEKNCSRIHVCCRKISIINEYRGVCPQLYFYIHLDDLSKITARSSIPITESPIIYLIYLALFTYPEPDKPKFRDINTDEAIFTSAIAGIDQVSKLLSRANQVYKYIDKEAFKELEKHQRIHRNARKGMEEETAKNILSSIIIKLFRKSELLDQLIHCPTP